MASRATAFAASALLLGHAEGHASMVHPPSWFDANASVGMMTQGGCSAGCEYEALNGQDSGKGCSCYWFTNYTFHTGNTTINSPKLRTFQNLEDGYDWTAKNPWRAPGTAPLHSPCGFAGGNPTGCPPGSKAGYECPFGGYGYGVDARAYYPNFKDVPTTTWTAGGVEEIAVGIIANHGGGWSVRLCKTPSSGNMSELTEDCFQQNVLEFYGNTSWAQYGDDVDAQRTQFEAVRVSEGTFPQGSQWTKNPVPACSGTDGGFINASSCGTPEDPQLQFPAPAPGIYGFGSGASPKLNFSIVELVQVPQNLEPGDYVVSFRWDVEQTSQSWQTCANVKVEAAATCDATNLTKSAYGEPILCAKTNPVSLRKSVGYGFNLETPVSRAVVTSLGLDYDMIFFGRTCLNQTSADALLEASLRVATNNTKAALGPVYSGVCCDVADALVNLAYNVSQLASAPLPAVNGVDDAIATQDWAGAAARLNGSKWCSVSPAACAEAMATLASGC